MLFCRPVALPINSSRLNPKKPRTPHDNSVHSFPSNPISARFRQKSPSRPYLQMPLTVVPFLPKMVREPTFAKEKLSGPLSAKNRQMRPHGPRGPIHGQDQRKRRRRVPNAPRTLSSRVYTTVRVPGVTRRRRVASCQRRTSAGIGCRVAPPPRGAPVDQSESGKTNPNANSDWSSCCFLTKNLENTE